MSIAITVDLSKVVIVTNNSIAQSGTDAIDYCERRGIPTANILSFNFGIMNGPIAPATLQNAASMSVQTSGLSGYVGLSFCAAMSALVKTFGASAILLGTWTPHSVDLSSTSVGIDAPLATVVGSGGDLTRNSFLSPAGDFMSSVPYNLFTSAYGGGMAAPVGTELWPYAPLTLTPRTSVPTGRLGCPVHDYLGNSYQITEQSLAANTAQTVTSSGGTGLTVSTLYDHAVSSAMAAELVDNSSKLHLMSSTVQRTGGVPPVWESTQMLRYAQAQGLNVFDPKTSYAVPGVTGVSYPGVFLYDLGLTTKIAPFAMTVPDAWVNSIDNPPTTWYGSGGIPGYYANSGPNGHNNWAPLPGAWSYALTSYTMYWARGFLSRGGAACHSTVSEPYTNNLLCNMALLRFLLFNRAPIAVASWLAATSTYSGEGTTVYGDPLYAPYKSSVLNNSYLVIAGSI